jgi:amino acid transporter
MVDKFKRALLGAPRDISNPDTFHRIALIALLAWVGLGADGLSSSAYGPDEAFRALGQHTYLAVALALATGLTVFVISSAYRGIIEHFPYGGGGYIVASQLLGPGFGVLSGSALLVDYVLTVSVSIASCADQIFSVLPPAIHSFKLVVEGGIIIVLVLLNLRGVKESIIILTPIFALFLLAHAILIVGGIGSHVGAIPQVAHGIGTGFRDGLGTLGILGMGALFLRAFSMGAGTFTGIEAVSNGLQIMREPKVETGKRTMLYMSISLALTAAGILILYLLFGVKPIQGMTMNAVLLEKFAGSWHWGGFHIGHCFVVVALASEAALLFVAAQAGFIDGPRVMANMSLDGWLPRRYAQLSDRLTMQNGVLLMGGAALVVLIYTHGDITALVTMYSINVFLTFSLSMTGMCRYWIRERKKRPEWKRAFLVQFIGLVVCVSILTTVVIEKFEQGAWVTLLVTTALVAICFAIRRHYRHVGESIRHLDVIMKGLPEKSVLSVPDIDPQKPIAVMLVGGYSGLGVHQLLQVQRIFPNQFSNMLFLSTGVIDSATMKGIEEVELTRQRTESALKKYVDLAHRLGFAADYRMSMGTEAVAELEKLCHGTIKEFPRAIFFMGKLIFEKEAWYHRILHNETAYQLQRHLHLGGMSAFVLTVRLPRFRKPEPTPSISETRA